MTLFARWTRFALVAAVVMGVFGVPARAAQQQDAWTGIDRVVAVGDVHGDYDQLVNVLRSAQLIDEQNNWTGAKTHLVQGGDVLDRGSSSRRCMDLLMALEKQADAAGGHVHALIGNHEAMNIYGDLRYVTPEDLAAYRDPGSKDMGDGQHGPGYIAHREHFGPNGDYGKWIRGHNAVIKINNMIFLHGGIGPKYASYSLHRINDQVRDELEHPEKLKGGIVQDPEGPLWYRGLAQGDETATAPELEKVLKNFKVEYVVIAHTFTDGAVTPRMNGRVLMIDIGLSRIYDSFGRLACLLVENGHPYALHRGQKLELPKDSGADLLRYLKQASALDPPPSSLSKRIKELEAKAGT